MAKNKKKRTKRYHGTDAAITTPVVHHYEAADRNKFAQWFVEHKLRVRIIGIAAAVAGVIALLVDGIATLFH